MAALIITQCFLNFKRAECVLQSVEPRFINQVKSESMSAIASLQGSPGSSVKSSGSKKQIENLLFNQLHHFTVEKTVQRRVCNLPKVAQQTNGRAGTSFHIPRGIRQNSCAVSKHRDDSTQRSRKGAYSLRQRHFAERCQGHT